MNSRNRNPILESMEPYWAHALMLLLVVSAVISTSDAPVQFFSHTFALPASWALLIVLFGAYVSGLWIGAASTRRKYDRRSPTDAQPGAGTT